ncbi:hypothetical protein HETIRDRAFT_242271, partial [Heterobasidion irregulare TC 32-1]
IKMAYGTNEYSALKRECRFYSHALRSLGGIAVPRCHGLFSTEEDGELVGRLVLDLCPPLRSCTLTSYELSVDSRRIIVAICKLHSVGVAHRNLDDYHRFVMQGQSVLIVDFSQARIHNCSGGTPFVKG